MSEFTSGVIIGLTIGIVIGIITSDLLKIIILSKVIK